MKPPRRLFRGRPRTVSRKAADLGPDERPMPVSPRAGAVWVEKSYWDAAEKCVKVHRVREA